MGPAHTEINAVVERESAGGFEETHVIGNDFADKLAKGAMITHPIDWEEYERADDPTFFAAATQHVIVAIGRCYTREIKPSKRRETTTQIPITSRRKTSNAWQEQMSQTLRT